MGNVYGGIFNINNTRNPFKDYYFMGGGACWNFGLYWARQCTRNVSYGQNVYGGIFNINNTRNPFKDYTQIKLPFCSGDMFAGKKDQFWVMPGATERPWKYMRGHNQAKAVLDWTLAQF